MAKVNAELSTLIQSALCTKDSKAPETYLTERSNLPGPRANLALIAHFADVIGEIVQPPQPPVEPLENLLDEWAELSLQEAPINNPREILPACAVLAYGQVAISRPDWWEDEIAKLHRAAMNPSWRVREMVAAALQRMLQVDWSRTMSVLSHWLSDQHPLVIRAVVAAVAEPPLLKDFSHAEDALTIQKAALDWFMNVPAEYRRAYDARALRQALGYTVSVAVAAAPEKGFALMGEIAALEDVDMRWIVRENLKKNRLSPWAGKVASLQVILGS